MTRLDSFIRRLQAQRDCLNAAAECISGQPGVVLELGLGNGRTYDHLRQLLPGREIYVFDRQVRAHPDCIPDDEHLLLGDIYATLKDATERFAGQCVLIHADIGTGVEDENRRMAAFLGRALAPLLAPGAIVVSDQPLQIAGTRVLPLPAAVPRDRYFMRQRT